MKERSARILWCALWFLFGYLMAQGCYVDAQQRLMGYDVTTRGGVSVICRDPVLWESLQEIECEDVP